MSVAAEVIAQIKAMPFSPFKAVEGLAEFALLQSALSKPSATITLKVSPTVFVIPLADVSGRQDLSATAFRQMTTIRFGCAIGVREVSDPKGAIGAETLDTLKNALRNYLVSWTPPSAQFPVEHARGALSGIGNGMSFWLEEYLCGLQIRKP